MARQRSPSFPYINIKEAVDLLQRLFNKIQMSPVNVIDAYRAIGISTNSSTSNRSLSTMISYGLLKDLGGSGEDKKIAVSELGRKICVDQRQKEKLSYYRQAVLNDDMMEQVFTYWRDGLPKDDNTIESSLKVDFGFATDRAATRFREVLKENFRYAELENYIAGISPSMMDEDDLPEYVDASKNIDQKDSIVLQSSEPAIRSDKSGELQGFAKYPIRLDGGKYGYLYIPDIITVDDANYIPEYLEIVLKKHTKNS